MSVFNPEVKWRQWLNAIIILNLLGGVFFIATEMLVVSWIVYPVLLVIAFAILRRRVITGAAFLFVVALLFVLVHLPFTPFGPEGSACLECARVTMWITLFGIPLLTVFVAAGAWRDLRTSLSSQKP